MKSRLFAVCLAVASVFPTLFAAAATTQTEVVTATTGIRTKVEARITGITWGANADDVIKALQKQIDDSYGARIARVYNPKRQDELERERDRKKAAVRDGYTKFEPNKGVSGYEEKTPGEFTYKNNESALEITRDDGGSRVLFFINEKLWKVFDTYELKTDGDLGDSLTSAVTKLETEFGAKAKIIPAKSQSPSYFGSTVDALGHAIWSDGVNQIRLVDMTHRSEVGPKTVGLVFEELATIKKLPSLRTNVEKKITPT